MEVADADKQLELLLEKFLSLALKEPKVLVITGDKGAGKSTTLKKIAALLEQQDKISLVSGFIAASSSVEKSDYFAQSIKGDFSYLLMTEQAQPNQIDPDLRVCKFRIEPDSFGAVEQFLISELNNGVKIIMIDEVAHLEKRGAGWASLIKYLQANKHSFIVSIRSKHVKSIMDWFNLSDEFVYRLD